MTNNTDLTKVLRGHSSGWVALSADSIRIVGEADTPKKALAQARRKKEKNAILVRCTEGSGAFVL